MKLLVVCLLAAALAAVLGAPMNPMEQTVKKLKEVLLDLDKLNKTVQHNDLMLNTPLTDDIEKCCSTTALACFRNDLERIPTTGRRGKKQLIKDLRKQIIENGVKSCSQEKTTASCKSCQSYPLRSSKEFLMSLQIFLQQSLERLM